MTHLSVGSASWTSGNVINVLLQRINSRVDARLLQCVMEFSRSMNVAFGVFKTLAKAQFRGLCAQASFLTGEGQRTQAADQCSHRQPRAHCQKISRPGPSRAISRIPARKSRSGR